MQTTNKYLLEEYGQRKECWTGPIASRKATAPLEGLGLEVPPLGILRT